MKGVGFKEDSWEVRNKGFSKDVIWVATKEGIPLSMQDELEDTHEEYLSITHEYLCDFLSTIEVKDNSKSSVSQIKRLTTSKAAPVNSDSN